MEQRRDPDFVASTSRPASPLAFVMLMYFFADAIAAAIIHGRPRSEVPLMFVVAVIASQALLLVMWVGLGNTTILLRLLCALSWCLWMTLLGTGEPLRWDLEVLATIGLMLLLAAAPFGLLKVLGFRIVRRRRRLDVRWRRDLLQGDVIKESREAPDKIEEFPELLEVHRFPRASVQFSIVQIFGWTALAGVMAVLARIAGMGLEAAVPMAISLGIATSLGFTTLWAVLGADQVGIRMLAPFAVIVLITLVAARFEGPGPDEIVVVVFLSLTLTTAAIAGVLGLFRAAGFRVRRMAPSVVGHVEPARQPSATNPWDAESG